jgi:cytochrome c-type biogenesis protein CcsB
MEKKIFSFLFSTRLMAFLFIAFAIAMISGTLIESKYNTETARILVYNAWWFEVIMAFFMINFIGNIKRYQLYKKEKWATLILHLSFILILLGAFITRYFSYEGMMPIREGAAENQVFSDKTFLTFFIDGQYKGEMKRKTIEKPVLFSPSPLVSNYFSINDKFDKTPFKVEFVDFVMGATETIKKDVNGILYLELVEAGGGTRHEHFLKEGEVQNIHNVLFALNNFTKGAINITVNNNDYTIQTPFDGNFMRMADKMQGKVNKDQKEKLMMRSLYNVGGTQFVFPEMAIKGVKAYISNNDYKDKVTDDAVILKVSNQEQEKTITLLGAKGKMGEPQIFKLGDLEYTVFFGSKIYELPFKLKLNKFIATKYPGTEKSYSAFESQVTVQDAEKPFDARIFMNNVLDYKGYRFFQASFDEDEKGTILSVNHDFFGTWITYIGYFLLYFGMMAILFTKGSRFADLKRKLEVVKNKKAKLLSFLVLFFSFNGFAQVHKPQLANDQQIDSLINKYKVSEEHAEKFGRLIIQSGKRMKPVNTFSSELLRKVNHSNSYNGMNPDQVFISMTQFPTIWYQVKLVYLKSGNDSIRKIIGIDTKAKNARFLDFFDDKGNYKLEKYLGAYKVANPNNFEKDIVEADKKVNLLSSALSGSFLKIFPIPNHPNGTWVSYPELGHIGIKGKDSLFTKQIFPIYFNSLSKAALDKNYKEADFYLGGISKYQLKYGGKIMPSQEKITSEILYNKYDLLQKLPYWYLTVAILMLTFVIVNIFKERKWVTATTHFMHIVVGFLFVLHTITLIARWYISGHAPWSNAYEAIVYVALATMFFGLAFDVKSKLTVAAGAFVCAMILAAAYANWIDPEIDGLQPVLNSYWLMIHVAVIVASYGPFALGMILGFVSLILILLTDKDNKDRMLLNIKEITYINEMALTVGLVMLTIGNFLGGQWANESWGRYWGWDPKETWALISIMVYAFVIHARFVPSLRGKWIFNLMSMYAFISILFTYYGVNFHLTGLHSYASGEAKSLSWIWISFATITVVGLISYPNYKKYYKKH